MKKYTRNFLEKNNYEWAKVTAMFVTFCELKITESARPFRVIFTDKHFQNEEKNSLEDPQLCNSNDNSRNNTFIMWFSRVIQSTK